MRELLARQDVGELEVLARGLPEKPEALARRLRGKHKPQYTPHVDTGDFVVVVNAELLQLTGRKMDDKIYDRYTGYHGGLRERTARQQRRTW